MLASSDRCSEDISIFAVIVAKLEFGDVQRHVFTAHFVKRADDTTFEDRPEAFNRVGVDGTDDVFALIVINHGMRKFFAKMLVANPLVGAEQADFVRHGFAHEGLKRRSANIDNNASHDVALAAHSADDRRLAGTGAASSFAATALVLVPVPGLAANEGFIDFNDTAELLDIFHEGGSDLVAHEPSGFVRAKTHDALDLQCAHTFLADEHHVDNPKPVAQRLVGVLENGSGDVREPIGGIGSALAALPMPPHGRDFPANFSATTRATNTLRPAPVDQVAAAGTLIREHPG
jgi:hypothetical protein